MTAPGALPLERLVELLARRLVLPLLGQLRGAAQPFGVLVAAVAATPPQVSQRLRELREAGFIEVDEAGDYRLSGDGRRLQGALEPLTTVAAAVASRTPRQRAPRGAATRGRGEPE